MSLGSQAPDILGDRQSGQDVRTQNSKHSTSKTLTDLLLKEMYTHTQVILNLFLQLLLVNLFRT